MISIITSPKAGKRGLYVSRFSKTSVASPAALCEEDERKMKKDDNKESVSISATGRDRRKMFSVYTVV